MLSLSYGKIIVKPVEKLRGLVPESFETYQVVDPGNIIVRTTDLQNDQSSLRIGHAHQRGIITSAYMCLETRPVVSNDFGYQYLNAYDLLKIIYGFGSGLRQNLDFSDIKRMPVLVPPRPEQAAIVRFLDHADRLIRRYIRAKQKLIKLLEEQKQAIIHRAVTRGLDPNVRLKPSGVEWLGDVPEHWEVKRLRFLTQEKLTYGANAAAEHTNPEWPRYLRITDFAIDGALRGDTFRSLPPEIARDYLVEAGDILLARSGATVGKAFLVPEGAGEVCHAGYLIRARPRRDLIDPRFLFAFTQSAGFSRWKDSTFIIATIQNIGADKYANLSVPVPPIQEQSAIMAFLSRATESVRKAIGGARHESSLLREYRIRLIADVVTGKLDVREAAAGLPDEAEESELPAESEVLTDTEEESVPDEIDSQPEEAEA
ncbi:MAG TPA: restriction endonuclease subunit S [Steroidobacteraceae bacterium]